ncbi:hypothetical protein FC70_GL000399 [Paucilactobacillus oligofermentans DSM 15707 = LMG 22743]|uniref:Lipoyl-binding domain-containing protein n=1 Tax=Paucilactobacillus oligofermentans DSM 15707 = LMG 22743 TaxID=1423778 RepID=A0A0R1RV65_9LACO|nr:glycine cleavage system protein H [Paucilactobacillus oligofermentans]KRL57925.1 hypothetical protein FC70_GL000399 [Paucilactobacillus oligofermentans DSM 15707 = LMG 22743]CUS26603.1 Glycine cleavage system H protein GcvH [Paucilactobacillus oligofermentans DSM 15707 = LMG 22743]
MSEANKYFWLKKQADGTSRIGISDSGVEELGSISFIDYPEVNAKLKIDGEFISVEAEKAVTDLVSPVNGTVAKINPNLENDLSDLNSTKAEQRWIVEINEA